MKNIIALLGLAVALCAAAFAAEPPAPTITDQRTALSRATDADGITTSVYIGRISSDPGSDGVFVVTVHFAVVKTLASGRVISDDKITNTVAPLSFTLAPQASSGVVALVKIAWDTRAATPPAP